MVQKKAMVGMRLLVVLALATVAAPAVPTWALAAKGVSDLQVMAGSSMGAGKTTA